MIGLAEARGGTFTAADAERVGMHEHDLVRLCRVGSIVRIRRGAYVLAESLQDVSPERGLAVRTRAVMATRPDSVASHQAALAMHGLPLYGLPLHVVDVLGDVNRVRLESRVRMHPRVRVPETVEVDGMDCVPVAVAVAQVTLRHGLLAGLVPADAALHRGMCTMETIAGALGDRARTTRAKATAKQLLAHTDPVCESPGETRTRLLLRDLDLGEDVRSQVSLYDGDGDFVARVDFLVGERVVVEFDGLVKYAAGGGREAVIDEKRREDAIRALGYLVVRLTWADLERPGRVGALVRRALVAASAQRPVG